MSSDRALIRLRSAPGRGTASIVPTLFIGDLDGRTGPARRFKEVLGGLLNDIAEPSESERQLAMIAAGLCLMAEDMEARLMSGEAIDAITFTTVANTARRFLSPRTAHRAPSDITPAHNNGASAFEIEFVRAQGPATYQARNNHEVPNG